jgi:hypothetical protein
MITTHVGMNRIRLISAAATSHVASHARGVDAVERWFTPEQVQDVLAFAGTLAVVE